MKCKLGDKAKIFFGPHCKASESGEAKYLLASHFDSHYRPSRFELSYVNVDQKLAKGLLQSSDVILAGKGQRSFAWAYDEDFGPCIPSSVFFVIRVVDEQIVPAYLALYLNSERVQNQLRLISAGGTIPSIPKKELQQLTISVPNLEQQHEIIAMAELLVENLSLTEKLLEHKKTLQKTILNRMITNQTQH